MTSEPVFLSGKEPALSTLDDRKSTKAIVLDFIDPVQVIEWVCCWTNVIGWGMTIRQYTNRWDR
jgi:hypothetical protein